MAKAIAFGFGTVATGAVAGAPLRLVHAGCRRAYAKCAGRGLGVWSYIYQGFKFNGATCRQCGQPLERKRRSLKTK